MIVVDSSVWIDAFAGRRTQQVEALDACLDRELVVVGDLVLCEILMGCRDDLVARRIEERLRRDCPVVALSSPAIAVRAASNYRRLRSLGLTIRSAVDLVIGAFCIAHGHVLLHSDRDFVAMERHLGLRTL